MKKSSPNSSDEEIIENGEVEELKTGEEMSEHIEEEESEAPLEEAGIEEVEKPLRSEEISKEILEEKIFTVPLRKAWLVQPKKRVPKAIRILRNFIVKHMKLTGTSGEDFERDESGKLFISNEVNERIWRRGIEKPPRKIKIRAEKDIDGNVTVFLAEGD